VVSVTNAPSDTTRRVAPGDETQILADATTQLPPQFATAVRGYDKAQVDDYVTRLHRRFHEMQASATEEVRSLQRRLASLQQAVSLPTSRSMTEFAAKMGEMLGEAADAAHRLREGMHQEAEAAHQAAGDTRDKLLAAAKAEAERIVEAAQAEGRAIRSEIAELVASRDMVLDELERLRTRLSDLVPAPERATGSPGATADDDDRAAGTGPAEPGAPREALALFDQEAQEEPHSRSDLDGMPHPGAADERSGETFPEEAAGGAPHDQAEVIVEESEERIAERAGEVEPQDPSGP
jgi:DivIVA domain-containing protein